MSNSHAARANPPPTEKDDGAGLIRLDFGQAISPLTWLAAGLGLLLVGLSMMGPAGLGVSRTFANVLMASGIAIILAAFGGQATVRGKGFVFAGVCGIAAGLLGYLHYVDGKTRKDYVKGFIDNLPIAEFAVDIKLDEIAPEKYAEDQFVFVAFADQLDHFGSASLAIEPTGEEAAEPFNFEIPNACIANALNAGTRINWKFDAPARRIVESKTGSVIATDPKTQSILDTACRTPGGYAKANAGKAYAFGLVSPAYAGAEGLGEDEIEYLLGALSSKDPNVRLDARDRLSRMAPWQVSDVLERLRRRLDSGDKIYRVKIGVVIAILEMLRRNGSLAQEIKLTDADRALLISFAQSEDEPLRNYTGELLALL